MAFDPSKSTDIEKMSAMDFADWRTGKQNEVSYKMISFRQITYIQFRSCHTLPEDHSTIPQGP